MKKVILICSCLALLLSACSKCISSDSLDDLRVYISATVEEAVRTRTPYVPSDDDDNAADAPDDEHPLHAAIWASTDIDIFPDSGNPGDPDAADYKVAYHTSANFESSGDQLLKDIIYSKDQTFIYFIGLHPQTDWTTVNAGEAASYTFDGTQDLMYAHKVHGYYSSGTSVYPTLTFRHLLTWLKFEIKAENQDVSEIWGKIKDIKIRSKQTVQINFNGSAEDDPNWRNYISFTGEETTLPLYITDTDTKFPSQPQEIPYLGVEEIAYVMCAPTDASAQEADYYLEIETEYRTATVPVNLRLAADQYFSESTMGKQFTILLTFKAGNNISVAATVTDWKTGGVSSGIIG